MKINSKNAKFTHKTAMEALKLHDHICFVYSTKEEQLNIVAILIKAALENGEAILYFLEDNLDMSFYKAIEVIGIDIDRVIADGGFNIIRPKEIYFESGAFNIQAFSECIEKILKCITCKGFKTLRVINELNFIDSSKQEVDALIELEVKLNDLIQNQNIAMLCLYDYNNLKSETIKLVISAHNTIIYDAEVCRNKYYIPPIEYLKQDKGKLEVKRLLDSLKDSGKTEDQLLNLAFEHQSFIDGFTGMIFYKNLEDRFIWVNDNYVKYIGIPRDILLSKSICELFPKADMDNYTNDDAEVITTGLPKRNIIESVITSEGERWVRTDKVPMFNRNGSIIGILGFAFDITEEVKLQRALRKSEELYHSVYDNSPLIFGIWDREFRFVDWNKRGEEVFGWSKEEVLGKRFMDILVPKQIKSTIKNVAQDLLDVGMARITENENITKDGTILFCEWHNTLLHDSEGNLVGAISLGLDKTESRKIEKERLEVEDALRKAKLEAEVANAAKTQFLANMSHEIRTPMNGVMGMAQMLMYTDLNDEQTEMVDVIKSSSKTLLQIINDILDLSKIEAGKVELNTEVMNVTDLFNRINLLFTPIAKSKNLSFETIVEKDIPMNVIADSVRLTQVITNLIGNSIKFTEKGKIKLLIEKKKSVKNKIQLMISVSDTGIGIKEEDIPRLFNYFTQLDDTKTKAFQGTGLGLAISKRIVEIMNGEICVESEVGKGSTFYFTCWVDILDEKKVPIVEDIQIEKQSQKNIQILLVEDDFVSQLVIKKICKMKSWNITVASDGKKALDILEDNNFDVILMDIQMPEMSGIDVTKIIRARERVTGKYVPIIATTAYAMNENREQILRAGMDEYISKPINMIELEQIINKLSL
jgi:PAS domain S-box-containing protein